MWRRAGTNVRTVGEEFALVEFPVGDKLLRAKAEVDAIETLPSGQKRLWQLKGGDSVFDVNNDGKRFQILKTRAIAARDPAEYDPTPFYRIKSGQATEEARLATAKSGIKMVDDAGNPMNRAQYELHWGAW